MPDSPIPPARDDLPTKGFPLFPSVAVAVTVAGCEVGSRGFSTWGRDGNLLFAPWNPPHPDFSFPAAFSLNFHQMARTKVSISFRISTTTSSSTHPPLSLLPIPRPPLHPCRYPLALSQQPLLTQNLITCFQLRKPMSNNKQTCHLPCHFRIRQLACHAMVVAPAIITVVDDAACCCCRQQCQCSRLSGCLVTSLLY